MSNEHRKQSRTTRQGWRIVAVGVLFLIFGLSFLTNHVGPSWLALTIVGIAAVLMVVGRQV